MKRFKRNINGKEMQWPPKPLGMTYIPDESKIPSTRKSPGVDEPVETQSLHDTPVCQDPFATPLDTNHGEQDQG